jgi:ribonuclease HI
LFKSFKTEEEALGFIQTEQNRQNTSPINESSDISNNDKQIQQQLPFEPIFDKRIHIHVMFDGGSRKTSGVAGAGAIVSISEVLNSGKRRLERTNMFHRTVHLRQYLGNERWTNNQAEYSGILCGLQCAHQQINAWFPSPTSLHITLLIQGDSNLVIRQLNGSYKYKSDKLMKFYYQVFQILDHLKRRGTCEISFQHIYRDDNEIADGMLLEL